MDRRKDNYNLHNSSFTKNSQKKLAVFFIMILLAFAVLCVRLVYLAETKGEQYEKQVLSQQQYDSSEIPYRRGDIYDVNGTLLATTEKVYTIAIDAKVMTSQIGGKMIYLEPTLKAIDKYLDIDVNEVRDYVLNHPDSQWHIMAKQVKYEDVCMFMDYRDGKLNEKYIIAEGATVAEDEIDKNEYQKVKGVQIKGEYKRYYPYGSLAADVIGFTNGEGNGNGGLEEYYNATLQGINGREYGYLNEDLDLERTVKQAQDGYNIYSTIDTYIQSVCEKYLKKFMDEHENTARQGNGAENIGCVVQDVNTGEILAMASYPTYNLNAPRDTSALLGSIMVDQIDLGNGYYDIKKTGTVITQDVINNMTSTQLTENLQQLWKNFCIGNTYEPGSVAKPFTVATALETGTVSANSTFECTGHLEIGGYKIKCHNGAEGTMTLEKAVAKSCNVTMMRIASMIGSDTFTEFQNIFNFGLKTNVDLAGEERTANLVYSADEMGPTDLATNSFGQNFNVTMIQMITAFSSLINGGYYYEPHLVKKVTKSDGTVVQNIEPRVLKQTISESTSTYIRQYCRAVVEYGTGKTARPAGYMIGGKTGTAETIDQNTHKRSANEYVVSFMGFAPADNPQVAIYVVVDRANATKQDDAKYATRIVRSVLTEILPYLQVFMTEEVTASEQAELDALNLEVTTQYAEKKKNEAVSEEDDPAVNADGSSPLWLSFPIDPGSGYRVDPATGYKYDAQQGFLIEGSEATMGADVPVNPNL